MEKLRLSEDAFQVIAEWHYYAILNLIETDDFKSDAAWIARRLGLSVIEVVSALDRLERLGFIIRKKAAVRRSVAPLKTSSDVTSAALRRSHRQNLEQAIAALEDVAVDDRDISSVTMPMDPRKMKEAKVLIARFKKEMSLLLKGGMRTEVYNFNLQLVPVTKLKR